LKTCINADPAVVESTSLSLKLRRNCTAGEASDPKVAVAMTQLGGVQAPLVVDTLVAVSVVTVAWMTIVSAAVATDVPLVPVIVTAVVDVGAPVAAPTESVDSAVLPDGGVTGLGLNPPVIPVGNGAARVTGELKPPLEETVTMIVAVPPGLMTMLLGLAEMPNNGVAVTKNVAVADLPVLPVTRTT
jgi:hypothetical protein